MEQRWKINRRGVAGLLTAGVSALAAGLPAADAATPDGPGAVNDMLAVLQAAKSLSFTVEASFGASVTHDRLRTLGNRASVVFARPYNLFALSGSGSEGSVQILISGGEATLFRESLSAKTTLKLTPESGAAFMVPGMFIPFLGLLAENPQDAFFGGINSVTAIAQGLPDQPEQTSLVSVMGGQFTGDVWVDKSTSLPNRVIGTWFGSKADIASSAALSFSNWSSAAPAPSIFSPKDLAEAKAVGLDELGL